MNFSVGDDVDNDEEGEEGQASLQENAISTF